MFSSSARSMRDVFGDAHTVAEAQRVAVDERAADALEPVGLARVHGRREAVALQQVERLALGAAGNPASGPAMSKPTTPRSRWRSASSAISVPRSRWRIALTSWPTRMPWPASRASSMPCVDALLHGLDRLVEGEPAREVLLGRPADLAVDDAVGGQILDEVARDAHEPLAGLHHTDGDVERLQVLDQRAGVGLLREPRRRAPPRPSPAGRGRAARPAR